MFGKSLRFVTVVASLGLTAGSAYSEPPVAPFYQAVMKMKPEGKLGQIIKKEVVTTPIPNAKAWRIAYISSDLNDKKTISTGLLVVPTSKAPKEGRPIVSWSHGTTGTAQNCGPSQAVNPVVPLNQYFLVGGNSWTDYGIPALGEMIKRGYIVVATDYQGLGGGGRHQYVVSMTQGRDAINAIRAAGSLKETGSGKKALIYGWSQGGGTALAAAASSNYVAQKGTAFDNIELVGFVAMAPPDLATLAPKGVMTDEAAAKTMDNLVKGFSDNIFNFAHLSMNLWGTQAAFPDKLKLTDLFTDEGAKTIDDILSNKCVHVSSDTLNYAYGTKFTGLLKTQPSNSRAWADALIAGSIPNAKPIAPVIIYWGTHDTVVPPVMGQIYRENMCQLGGNVARVQLPGEQTHFSTPSVSQPLYMPWIEARFAGQQAPNGCAAN